MNQSASGMRTYVMGDPQASFAHVTEILRHHGLLNMSGQLLEDTHLISIGDHFDYGTDNLQDVGEQGRQTLLWLAQHTESRCTLLLGNHDTVRVMEFAGVESDALFAKAHVEARRVYALQKCAAPDAAEAEAQFLKQFPMIPAVGYAARDFSAFSIAQRTLVVDLLLQRRFRLAVTVTLEDGSCALVSHAGITVRELEALRIAPNATPRVIADALNAFLFSRVDRVRELWLKGNVVPLDLAPLLVAARNGQESGGMLFHRPSNPMREGIDRSSEYAMAAPRRFDPRKLPAGLRQVVGHIGHRKCLEVLGDWVSPDAAAHKVGGIRTLRVLDGAAHYTMGCLPAQTCAADLIMVDGEMRSVAPEHYPLLRVSNLSFD
jgi:hypothetical protein